MSDSPRVQNNFVNQVNGLIEKNISNEQFGVSELAEEMNMSRSNLLRKVKKETNLSVSQLISQVRLQHAMELLQNSGLNVSQVAHQVGFNSTSYFIKCFREFYGYPPGETGKRQNENSQAAPLPDQPIVAPPTKKRRYALPVVAGFIAIVLLGILIYKFSGTHPPESPLEKSIAVLPFKNDSNDSGNVYLINGLMEYTISNLQKIKNLKVISRTSVEKYRNSSKSIPEIARELGVTYCVEGSGQKIGDRILLNVQLIEASSDKHLWANQYRRELKDIFDLQEEISKDIAKEVRVAITPEEEKKIEKKYTNNPEAYDNFLKGKDLFYQSTGKSLEQAIPYFKKAIDQDNEFALAYATATMAYYYLDLFSAEKKYSLEINSCADKAMTLDPKLVDSQIAKALSFAQKKEYDLGAPLLEKALEQDPNSGLIIHFLAEFYSMHVPNTAKYLKYALKGVQLDIVSHDSVTTGFKYFHLSNALMQAGFVDEALLYVNKSLEYDPKGFFPIYLRPWILFAKNRNHEETKQLLIKEFEKAPARTDLATEIARVCYLMRDYKGAWPYYKRWIDIRESMHLNIYRNENLKMSIVLRAMGMTEKADELMNDFKDFAEHDLTIHKHYQLALYYSAKGDTQKAIEHLKLFSKEHNFHYWILLYDDDPAFDAIKAHPEYREVMSSIEKKFWKTHKEIRATIATPTLTPP